MNGSHWNRQGRHSGGSCPVKIPLPKLDRNDVELLKQEMKIRREFGEEGVRQFWEEIEKRESGQ